MLSYTQSETTPPYSPVSVEGMQHYSHEPKPYLGYKSIWRGNEAEEAEALKSLPEINAWPDWVEYFERCRDAGCSRDAAIGRTDRLIKSAGWRQNLADVLLEYTCRNEGKFVLQTASFPVEVTA